MLPAYLAVLSFPCCPLLPSPYTLLTTLSTLSPAVHATPRTVGSPPTALTVSAANVGRWERTPLTQLCCLTNPKHGSPKPAADIDRVIVSEVRALCMVDSRVAGMAEVAVTSPVWVSFVAQCTIQLPPPLLQRRAGYSCARVFSATKPSLIFLAIPIYIVKTARFEQGFARGPLERPLRGAVSCLL